MTDFSAKKNRNGAKSIPTWRRRWDLNPRAAHHDNTISNRARYDHFDTSPYFIFPPPQPSPAKVTRLLYHVFFKKQVFLANFFRIF